MPNLTLENREITIILDALSSRPYMEVAALIRSIVHQASEGNGNEKGNRPSDRPGAAPAGADSRDDLIGGHL